MKEIVYRVARMHLAGLDVRYIKKLLARSREIEPELDVSYGQGRQKGAPLLEGLLDKLRKNEWVPPQDNADLFSWLSHRNVPDEELLELRKVPPPKILVPQVDTKIWEQFEDFAAKPVQRQGLGDSPVWNAAFKVWAKAFQTLKLKYPVAWKIYQHRVRQVLVTNKGIGSEDGSWQEYVSGGTLMLRFREKPFSVSVCVSILLHEIGHVFEDNFDILDLMNLDLYGMGHPPHITSYAEKNVSEDFAETFMYYWLNRGTLKSKTPLKFQDMHARISKI